MPPAGPAAPGAYDLARAARFKEIGAVGYTVSRAKVAADRTDLNLRIVEWRRNLAQHIRRQLPGTAGAVAAALMTGDRGAIPGAVLQDMRDAGLAHLSAISGLHVGLIADGRSLPSVSCCPLCPTWPCTRPSRNGPPLPSSWAAVAVLLWAP